MPQAQSIRRWAARWLPWLVGVGLLAGVVYTALHFSEAEGFVRIAREARPWWLAAALYLQALTYSAQGEVFCLVGRAGGTPLRRWTAYRLSLAKIFVDQAIPSAGLSGTALIAASLERGGMPRPVVAAAMAVDHATYYAAYVLCLGAALGWLALAGDATTLIVGVSAAFCVFGAVFGASFLLVAGRRPRARWLARLKPLQAGLDYLAAADRMLAWRAPLLGACLLCQLAIVALDAATVGVCLASLGARASPGGVFASFMVSSLLRTLGVVPGGLGTYEAASVLTLKAVGVSIPAALAATLLFRGFSFWLPLVPGLWLSRHAVASASGPSHHGE
ncbi:MAG TPA: lysylphosphatidylglycerol synthase transmembrane domain-containing protein [Myxococcales bacterium]|nr:lysylphosphatidylglycerol synthase transmembrane domain-containing protein [Myxococcales bacterium]